MLLLLLLVTVEISSKVQGVKPCCQRYCDDRISW